MARLPGTPSRPLPPLRSSDIKSLQRGTRLVRAYFVEPHETYWNTFRHWGPAARSRFDHMPPPPADHPGLGVMYVAGDGPTALLEAFQATRTVNRTRDNPWLATFATTRSLRLLDIGGSWPTRAGASQALSAGDAPTVTQAWARAIYADYPNIDGVIYPSAMRGRPRRRHALEGMSIALFERSETALPAHPRLNMPLGHPGLADPIAIVAVEFGYDIV